jgi:glucose-6-phosphate dehydrogenase assembly protein OpcA
MAATLWDTTGTEVVQALLAERRAAGALASGLALSLVVVVDEKRVRQAEAAATIAGSAHPCRVLIVVRRSMETDTRLDAEVQVGGRLGATEAVVMRMYGRLALHAESVILPLLAPDAPVVTWWHGTPPDEIATDALGVLATRRVTDCAQSPAPLEALRRRAADFVLGDSDLAWARTTPWRSLLASALDAVRCNPESASVRAEAANPSALLLSGWISSRLDIPCAVEDSGGPGISAVELRTTDEGGETYVVGIERPDGRSATLKRGSEQPRALPLPRRELGDLMAEELRRMDPDFVYAEALARATQTTIAAESRVRTLIWRDPALQSAGDGDSSSAAS